MLLDKFSTHERDSVEYSSELNGGQKLLRGVFILWADTLNGFHTLDKVFHTVAKPVSASMKWNRPISREPRRDASGCRTFFKVCVQHGAIVALVGDHPLPSGWSNLLSHLEVRPLPRIQSQVEGSPPAIHKRGELCVEAGLGATDGLRALASSGIRTGLMQLDVRGIQKAKLTLSAGFKVSKHHLPKPHTTPSRPAGIDTLRRTEDLGQITPGAPGAGSEDEPLDHAAMAPRRTTTRRYRYRSRRGVIDFFSRSQSGSRRMNGGPLAMSLFATSDRTQPSAIHP